LEDFLRREKETKNENLTVLGIPRGGLIVADVVAARLKADFDIVVPRKLRMPHNEEAAFGAIMSDGTLYIEDRIVRDFGISEEYIEKEKQLQMLEIERRFALYRKKELQPLENKINKNTIAILVDDGAASGATVIAATRWIRRSLNLKKLVIGLPIAPKKTVELLKQEANHVEVVTVPSSTFNSVGQYYQYFESVSDERVIEIMKQRNLLV
jgi:putative phosphoribosyl transferase